MSSTGVPKSEQDRPAPGPANGDRRRDVRAIDGPHGTAATHAERAGKPGGNKLRNWAGSRSWTPSRLVTPRDEGQVAEALVTAADTGRRVKPVGSLHSWSDVATTDGTALSLDAMSRVLAVDVETRTVRVQAGIRLRELLSVLQGFGLTLPVRGSIVAQSLAGAIATGTHGSAPGIGHLGTLVSAVRLVTPDGTVHELTRDAKVGPRRQLFDAALVSLGALGVVTEFTLSVVDDFVLEEITEVFSVVDAVRDFDAIRASAPFVKLWWFPHTDRVIVFRYRPTDEPPALSAVAEWVDENLVNRYVFSGLMHLGRRIPRVTPSVNRLVARAYLAERRRVGRAADVLGLAMPPRHGESEWSVPVDRGAEALQALVDLVAREDLLVGFIQEIRFVAADRAWLSPMHQRSACCVGVLTPHLSSNHPLHEHAERLFSQMAGRPHWAKDFTVGADYFADVYPRYREFVALRDHLDPTGALSNAFTLRVFGR